ncbi:transposase, partial [Sutterella wadsworthensis]|uniref:transposase n=1 Tax=Sutterella wadsworthensis TaxID=40545 RepID=UPI001C0384EE
AGNDEQPAIAFDSTSHSVYGNSLKPYARQGFNKDGDGLDIYKIITFYSLDSGLPVSFELQPGNIPDVISLV